MQQDCPLCFFTSNLFYQDEKRYFRCPECDAIFLDPSQRQSYDEEKQRYELHQNDVEDLGYQKFVSPIANAIQKDFLIHSQGLDFGAGTGPVLSKMLQDKGYTVNLYDPFFHNNKYALQQTYDFIGSCEVIEHFYNPRSEFALLYNLLNKNGKLYLMTELYNDGIDFANWYYRKDPTHVFFYTVSTFQWIQSRFQFINVSIDKRLIIFSK